MGFLKAAALLQKGRVKAALYKSYFFHASRARFGGFHFHLRPSRGQRIWGWASPISGPSWWFETHCFFVRWDHYNSRFIILTLTVLLEFVRLKIVGWAGGRGLPGWQWCTVVAAVLVWWCSRRSKRKRGARFKWNRASSMMLCCYIAHAAAAVPPPLTHH